MNKGKITYGKLLRFVSVGALNTLAGMAIMFGLYNIFGWSYWASSAVNYISVSILSYILNKRITFKHRGRIVESGIKFAVNIAVCYLVAYGTAKPLIMWMMEDSSVWVRENIAMLIGMCIFTALNYLGQSFFVFGEKIMDYKIIYEKWLKSSHLTNAEKQQLKVMSEEEIYEAFYKNLRFGTAGMRGIMGMGINRINRFTIKMAAKGLAMLLGKGAKIAIAFDTRNDSDKFAEEAAKVLAAAGIDVFLFDRYSPVPLLSYAVRYLGCDGGIVITASHNMPVYNGFKVYDETGSQMGSSMAAKISDNIDSLEDKLGIETTDLDDPHIKRIGQEVISPFMDAVQSCKVDVNLQDEAALRVVYTPIHGSGREYVLETLRRAGFKNVTLVKEQADYNGDFPTVKKPNPEESEVFHIAEKIAIDSNGDIIVGTDPDSDRIGIGVNHKGKMIYPTGNQIGALMVDFLGRMKESRGKKLITSIVTGDMGADIAASYGIDTIRTFTGFKDLAAEMNKLDDNQIFMTYEESYGYLTGTHIRDKDGISSAMLACQMAAYWKQQGKTLIDALESLYQTYGYYIDDQESFVFEGSYGADKIVEIMKVFRREGMDILDAVDVIDYRIGKECVPESNVLKFVFDNGSWLAVRPSGTEPKIKFYYCIKEENRNFAEALHNSLKQKVDKTVFHRNYNL